MKLHKILTIILIISSVILFFFLIPPTQYDSYNRMLPPQTSYTGETAYYSPNNITQDSSGTYSFINLNNVKTQNDSYAECNMTTSGFANWLIAEDFGFSLDANLSIIAIIVEVDHYAFTYIYAYTYQLRFNYSNVGDTYAGTWVPQSDNDTYTLENNGFWGTTLIANDINDPSFGIAILYRNYYGSEQVLYVDHIRIKIQYQTLIPPTYENLKESYDPLELGFNETITITALTNETLDFVYIQIGNQNYTMFQMENNITFYYHLWKPITVGLKEYTIYIKDNYSQIISIIGTITVFSPIEIITSSIFLIILLFGLIILYMNDKVYLVLIVYLFSLVFGSLAMSIVLFPLTPYIQIFFLLFQSIVFTITALTFFNKKPFKVKK